MCKRAGIWLPVFHLCSAISRQRGAGWVGFHPSNMRRATSASQVYWVNLVWPAFQCFPEYFLYTPGWNRIYLPKWSRTCFWFSYWTLRSSGDFQKKSSKKLHCVEASYYSGGGHLSFGSWPHCRSVDLSELSVRPCVATPVAGLFSHPLLPPGPAIVFDSGKHGNFMRTSTKPLI